MNLKCGAIENVALYLILRMLVSSSQQPWKEGVCLLKNGTFLKLRKNRSPSIRKIRETRVGSAN